MLRPPRRCAGAISDKKSGTACKFQINLGHFKFGVTFFVTCCFSCIYLIAKSDPKAKEESSNDQHDEVNGSCSEADTNQEEDRSKLHRRPPSKFGTGGGSQEAGHKRGYVKRRCEQLQELVIVFAVVVLVYVLLPLPHRREKLLQEIVHRRHSTF